ncbi:TFIIS helical bundle-like domain-containing protein [Ditylenchus destructor]|nr:TFIIS helical bundle-like domain-containing protein [Ditylenchus destructor]
MLRKKRSEKKRRHRNKDSILLISDSDDKVQAVVQAMGDAANEDRVSNQDKRPAIQKRKLLPMVRSMLLKADLFETLLDNGMMSSISEWLAPLPDKSLPALEVRSTLLKILESYPRLEQGILKQSGLGKAVMFLFKHPKETKENKTIAAKLIREWSRPIFQLDTDFRSVSREERLQRDYAHMPEAKRRRISRTRNKSGSDTDDESADLSDLRPGQVGFINRARVPKPSTKDYVIRPKSTIEGRFQGPSKSRQTDRFDRAQREFRERNRAQKAKRAIGVNIAGNKMDI